MGIVLRLMLDFFEQKFLRAHDFNYLRIQTTFAISVNQAGKT
jgi:hypothetical protein